MGITERGSDMKELVMKSVLLKMKPKYWELVKTHEKTIEVQKTRPMDVKLPVRVFVCIDKKIVGEFLASHFLRRNSVGGLAKRAMVPLQELIVFAGGEEVYAWTIEDPVAYDRPRALEELGVKRMPGSWMYVQADEFWPKD